MAANGESFFVLVLAHLFRRLLKKCLNLFFFFLLPSPQGFVYLYNCLQIGNGAWKQYLRSVLSFSDAELNGLLIVSYVLLYLGVMFYKYYLIKSSWRGIYIITTLLNFALSMLQICLIMGLTFGISNFLFALGDDAMAEFIGGIQFLPTTIMMVNLCPSGSEGASYAMFTTVNNAALNMSGMISTVLLGVWDVSKHALERITTSPDVVLSAGLVCNSTNFEALNEATTTCVRDPYLGGMIKLTLLTSFLQFSGILFVGLLPGTAEELKKLNHGSKSSVGGFIFLFVTFGSLLYSVIAGVLNIVAPGWAGES